MAKYKTYMQEARRAIRSAYENIKPTDKLDYEYLDNIESDLDYALTRVRYLKRHLSTLSPDRKQVLADLNTMGD